MATKAKTRKPVAPRKRKTPKRAQPAGPTPLSNAEYQAIERRAVGNE